MIIMTPTPPPKKNNKKKLKEKHKTDVRLSIWRKILVDTACCRALNTEHTPKDYLPQVTCMFQVSKTIKLLGLSNGYRNAWKSQLRESYQCLSIFKMLFWCLWSMKLLRTVKKSPKCSQKIQSMGAVLEKLSIPSKVLEQWAKGKLKGLYSALFRQCMKFRKISALSL